MNTSFTYEYRDGANYKTRHTEILSGVLTMADIESCLSNNACDDGFIPGQVGMKELQEQLGDECQTGITGDDHVWHQVLEIVPTEDAPGALKAEDVKAAFLAAKGNWDILAACERTGVDPL